MKFTMQDFQEFVIVAMLASVPTMLLLVCGVALPNIVNPLAHVGMFILILAIYFVMCVLVALNFIVIKHYDKFKVVFYEIINSDNVGKEKKDCGDDSEEHF